MEAADDRLSLFCDRCKHDGYNQDSMAWCVDCRKHFCSECLLENKVKKKKHAFLSTMKYREFLTNSYFGMFENCYVHSDEESKFYCLKHQTSCCSKCRRQIHAACGSSIIKLSEIAMKMGTSVAFPDLKERLKDSLLLFETLINENYEYRRKLEAMKNKVINDFLQIRVNLDEQLERIQTELFEQVDKSYQQQTENLDSIMNYMEEIKEEVNQLKVDSDIVAEKLPDLELYFFVKAAEKHQLITDKAIHELQKTKIDLKFRHDIELGMKDLDQLLKRISKVHIRGDNISNVMLEEKRNEKERRNMTSVNNEDLSLPLGRDTPSTILSDHSPRGVGSTYRITNRATSRTFDTESLNEFNESHNGMTVRSTSRASSVKILLPTNRSENGRISQLSLQSQKSPREYEQLVDKFKYGRLSQIRESDIYVNDDENSGIKTNIRNENFSLTVKFGLPKRKKPSFATDVCCISRGRFILSDYNNKCIMLYDLNGTLTREVFLDEHPQSITVVSGSEIAVSLSGNRNIKVLDTNSLQTVRHVTAPYECEGITFTENKFVVNCKHEGIFVLNKSGKVISKFPKLTGAMYLNMSLDHKLICSMGVPGVIMAMTLDGRETFRIKGQNIKRPSGVTWDQFGNIYASIWAKNSIIQIKDNGKSFVTILDSDDKIVSPWGLDYDRSSDFLVVSTDNGESVAIFKRNSHR